MDIIYSIKPEAVNKIVEKQKNHEFRSRIPNKIPNRIWIYTTKPIGELKYFIDVDFPVEFPSKIKEDGKGNKEFNIGFKNIKYAYPIIHLYELDNPLTLEKLKLKYSITPPQSYIYLENNSMLKEYVTNCTYKKLY